MKLSPEGIAGIRRDIQDLTEYSWERTRFEKLLDHISGQDDKLEELEECATRYVKAHAYSAVRMQGAERTEEYRWSENELAKLLGLNIDKDED